MKHSLFSKNPQNLACFLQPQLLCPFQFMEERRMFGSGNLAAPIISRQGKKSTRCKRPKVSYRPMLEPLEDRITPYVFSGCSWANTNISVSFVPDGTIDLGYASDLFSLYNASYPTATWQLQFAKALQTWADASSLNFHFVTEQIDPTTGVGYPSGTSGPVQGDPRFGDIRLDANTGLPSLGQAWYPSNSGTIGGDITLNGTTADSLSLLYSLLLHETGIALGLSETTTALSVLNSMGTNLYPDDIAGIQALYGAPPADGSNNSLASATLLALSSGSATIGGDISSMTDVDYYQVTAPAGSNSLVVSADARGLSLFDPKISVYDATGKLLGTASAATYGSVATVNLTGLVAGQSYFLQVAGATSDVFGMGAYKLTAQFGGGAAVAPVKAPSGLTATPVGDPQVVLQWTNNAPNATGNVVERSSDGVNWTQIASLPPDSTTYTDPNVPDGVTYYYEVWAVDGAISSPSSPVSVTLVPLTPGSVTASAVSPSQINLSWSDVTGETGFTIQRSVDGVTWTPIATTGSGVTSYRDVALAAGTTYQYEVSASNAGGASAYSSPASATTLAAIPDAPTGVTASTVSTSQIAVAWNSDTGATAYKIYRSHNGVTNWVQVGSTTAGVTSWVNSGLVAGATYFYQVQASNGTGTSAASNTASATTLLVPNAPTGLAAIAVSVSQINLAWTSVPGVSGYRVCRSTGGYWYYVGTTSASVTWFHNTGLYAGHTYFYSIIACAAGRISVRSAQTSATTIPAAPAAVLAQAVSANQINLTWKNVTGETGFLIERSLDGINWTTAGSTPANVTSFQDTGLLPGTMYFYRIRASNSGGISLASQTVWAIT
jgi:fibronectin type 3 domain-containing protein